jgi:hypothetical protein
MRTLCEDLVGIAAALNRSRLKSPAGMTLVGEPTGMTLVGETARMTLVGETTGMTGLCHPRNQKQPSSSSALVEDLRNRFPNAKHHAMSNRSRPKSAAGMTGVCVILEVLLIEDLLNHTAFFNITTVI